LRFQLAGKDKPIIMVKIHVNGKGPFDFAVDTGAAVTVLSEQTAQKLGVLRNPSTHKEGHCCGGSVDLSMTTVELVQVGSVEVSNLPVALMDLSTISKCVETPLAGIIGYSFMKDYRVIIDYPKKQISFEKAEKTEE